jgi:hypothetical protein
MQLFSTGGQMKRLTTERAWDDLAGYAVDIFNQQM